MKDSYMKPKSITLEHDYEIYSIISGVVSE